MEWMFALLVVTAGAAWWLSQLRAREQALAVCRDRCRDAQVQLLDYTVVLTRWRFARKGTRWLFMRTYTFEFSRDGADRRHGFLILHGRRVSALYLEGPEYSSHPPHRH